MSNADFEKSMETIRKHSDIKLVTTKTEQTIWYHKQIIILQNFNNKFVGYSNKKAQLFMNKPVYLQLPTLKLIKIVMYEFWYDCIKPKYGEKAKLCYVDTDSFIVYTKTDDICETRY